MTDAYVHDSYAAYRPGSERSAAIVADLILPLLRPESVLDVGCGTGGWLEAFRARGVRQVHGIDGPWAPAAQVLRPGEFTEIDFQKASADPAPTLPLGKYDLVTSLEFLEHVTADRADMLARFLARQGDVLLVSAAIPLQGGQHHVNERWPEYWVGRFAALGFEAFDGIRFALWNEADVESWYRQNMILYFRGGVPDSVRKWGEALALNALESPRAVVHPEFYAKRLGRLHMAVTRPLRFAHMLLTENRAQARSAPPFGNLGREP
ncbi:class I SAM-dependent methyltransferase [Sandaracinobacter sp. RS1-74]|uniref:class I SAM-dependent methyltransferase n=1 Tax=Sandaracinobacteroides sayramensis TaxID=2913411 RepID=UPI001EDC8CA3|nr:class I SAM-dependent methyltransferase [Sandaracinobacteroides sayramensis]MCG2840745.1 class I SAM-dependent methyltransferase [Sandaracinobacteroides sayramensis]